MLFALFTLFVPVIYAMCMMKNLDTLNKSKMKKKVGNIYKGLKLFRFKYVQDEITNVRRKNVVAFPLVFTARRTIFTVTTVALIEHPYF